MESKCEGYINNSVEMATDHHPTIDLTFECRKITAEEQQQEFCSYLGYQSETIIWDEYVNIIIITAPCFSIFPFIPRYDPEINPDIKGLLMKKINLIFGDQVEDDETIVSGEESVATTPSSDIDDRSDSSSDAEKKAATKRASRNERFMKMKETLVDAIWNQS